MIDPGGLKKSLSWGEINRTAQIQLEDNDWEILEGTGLW